MHFLNQLALLATTISAIPLGAPKPVNFTISTSTPTALTHRLCGANPPTPELKAAHNTARLARRTTLQKRGTSALTAPSPKVTVDTVFHIISTKDTAKTITKRMVANQFGALQAAYAPSNISFRLLSVNYHVNDTWATDAADQEMKTALRKGSYSTLNVYFQTNLSSPATSGAAGAPAQQMLGYCTLPANITYAPCDGCAPVAMPPSSYAGDGCNVHAFSMPNGPLAGYNLGKTAVHEVGHWFGLLHTFEGESCDDAAGGDFIDDTPHQSTPTQGCPVKKDTCQVNAGCVGLDPVWSFMDYSSDACYSHFSTGQTHRMHDMYAGLRAGL